MQTTLAQQHIKRYECVVGAARHTPRAWIDNK